MTIFIFKSSNILSQDWSDNFGAAPFKKEKYLQYVKNVLKTNFSKNLGVFFLSGKGYTNFVQQGQIVNFLSGNKKKN